MPSSLILSGGIFHDFAGTSTALASLLETHGIEARIEEDIERGLGDLQEQPVDLLVLNCLRWEMHGEKYASLRDGEALTLSPQARQRILSHLDAGGAIVGMHTASICFSDWPQWGDILGAAWAWGASWHPAPQTLSLTPTAHPLVSSIRPFELSDELYCNLSLRPGNIPLLYGHCAEAKESQPVMWLRNYGGGRIVYDALGHDSASLAAPMHARALEQAIGWALEPRAGRERSEAVSERDARPHSTHWQLSTLEQ